MSLTGDDILDGFLTVASVASPLASDFLTLRKQEEAIEMQTESYQKGIDLQREQFDKMQELLNPYVEVGTGAIQQQQALAGLLGAEAQKQAVQEIEQDPQFQALARQGEEAILQQASATGGLRGGNVQGALAQYRPQLLNQQIQQRYAQLGGLAGMGQASAAGVGASGMGLGSSISNLLAQQGAVAAQQPMAQAQLGQSLSGRTQGAVGTLLGAYTGGGF